MFEKILKSSPSIQIAFNKVKENLDTGVWRAGERLPPVRKLASIASVSVRTMARAIALLKQAGQISGVERSRLIAGSHQKEIADHIDDLQKALLELRNSKGLNFAMLMVTDVVRGSSRLLVANPLPSLLGLPYKPQPDGTWVAEGIVSRKKQLLPVILGLIEQ